MAAKHTPVQFGQTHSADFGANTMTVEMEPGYVVAVGPVAVVPRGTYDDLTEALQWMLDTFGDRNRLPKVLEAASAIHKARAAIAKATGSAA